MTPIQYAQLEELYQKYKDNGFVVLAFPCNQFGNQESGSNADIKAVVREDKGATFPLFAKVKVNGSEAHPAWRWMTSRAKGTLGASVLWNFTKFLIGRDGVPIERFGPPTKPLDLEPQVRQALGLDGASGARPAAAAASPRSDKAW